MNTIHGILTRERARSRQTFRQLCRSRWGLLFIAAIFLVLSAPAARAQTTAQLTGTVQDNSGAMIPGAQVTLTDQATGIPRVVQTNRQGLYAFPSLVPGTYNVKIEAKSFQSREITG